jgi:hypothetical protein
VKLLPPTLNSPFSSISIAPAPATQHLPHPRATTAAWLVMPPVAVRMPAAACMPSDVLGAGLLADQDDLLARVGRSTASSAVNASLPDAAPGEAGRPLRSRGFFFGLRRGRSSAAAAGQVCSGRDPQQRLFL